MEGGLSVLGEKVCVWNPEINFSTKASLYIEYANHHSGTKCFKSETAFKNKKKKKNEFLQEYFKILTSTKKDTIENLREIFMSFILVAIVILICLKGI